MSFSADILIKIFSGPHLGAEVPLAPGSYTLGSGGSCDIILQDSTVAERHVTITVPENGKDVSVTVLDAPVSFVKTPVQAASPESKDGDANKSQKSNKSQRSKKSSRKDKNSDQIGQGSAPWPAQTIMMAGTCALAWKKGDQDWGALVGSSDMLDAVIHPKPAEESGLETGSTASGEKEKTPKTIMLSPWVRRGIKGIGIFLLLIFIFGPCMGIKSTREARDMKDLLQDEDFDYLKVKQTNIGVMIQGTVDTQADRSRLWQLAGKVDYPVFIDILVNEERAYAVKVALSVRGLFPEVELDEKDIILKGYMRDKLIEGAAKVWVKSDISHVNEVRSHMVYAFQVWPVLKDRLIQYKLDKLLKVRFHPGVVEVEGELDFDQRQTLETVKGEVCDELHSPIAFWDSLTAPGFSQEWNDSLNASLRSKYAPDPGLAQLFLDSQSAKGVPAFVATTPAFKAGDQVMAVPRSAISTVGAAPVPQNLEEMVKAAEKIETEDGHKLAVIRDEKGDVKGAVLLDDKGNIVKTPGGNPIFLPVVKDKDGNVVTDKNGNPVFAKPLSDDKGQPIYQTKDEKNKNLPMITGPLLDADGNVIRDKDGNPVMGRVAVDENGQVIRDAQGNPMLLDVARDERGNPLRDKNGNLIPITVVRNANGDVVRDKDGNPLLAPALLDKDGNVVRDKHGRPVAPRVITGAKGQAARDKDGNLIPDTDANKVLTGQTGSATDGGTAPGPGPNERAGNEGAKGPFGSGTAFAKDREKEHREQHENPLAGLNITSITMEPLAFISVRDGQKFFVGGKLPSGWVIHAIATDHLVVEKHGKKRTVKLRTE